LNVRWLADLQLAWNKHDVSHILKRDGIANGGKDLVGVDNMLGWLGLRRKPMNLEESKAKKRIPLAQLQRGMYVVELDQPWLKTPFFSHSRLIENGNDIELLAKHGIREVVIDLERSADAETTTPAPEPFVGENGSITEPSAGTRARLRDERILRPLNHELAVARGIHKEALATAQGVFDGVGRVSRLNSPAAKQTVTDLLGSVTRSPEANLLLIQMRRFQNDLFTHSVNVCVLSLVVGTLEGFAEEVYELGLGALLHDIGQVRLPRNLLRKHDGFTDQERRLVEQHPTLGAAMLEQEESIPTAARRIVMEHHERLNGTGYPQKLGGDNISPLSQIVAITDAYDAMIIGRNGILRRPIDVLRQLYLDANAGAFSRDLVEKVIRSLGVYPVGSLVELNTGERGIVLAANRTDTLRPTIRLILSRDGLPLLRGPILSLAEEKSVAIGRQIVRTLDPGKERIDIMSHLTLATGFAR
jgi:HD-GYP domain-containing protein (c-di-GMP phosphodiesterase class II)